MHEVPIRVMPDDPRGLRQAGKARTMESLALNTERFLHWEMEK